VDAECAEYVESPYSATGGRLSIARGSLSSTIFEPGWFEIILVPRKVLPGVEKAT
jgi:hypothetical protein